MGSSACKAVAFSDDGRILVRKTACYQPVVSPHPSWAEVPAQSFWFALVAVARAIASELVDDPVEVLSISSHGETLIPVDSRGQPVTAAILNMDNRAVAEAQRLIETLGGRHIFDITGLSVHCMYPA